MERIPAFKPKTQEVEGSTQEKEKTEGPLQSLEKDKSQISGFNFALEAVLAGDITKENELQALASANPEFDNDGDLKAVGGGFVIIRGQYVKRDVLVGKDRKS